ncbi:hypothetical protein P8452_01497 [Trifolium repens]|nr:hypothetical protein P8452_01497 [Trifolium repens]
MAKPMSDASLCLCLSLAGSSSCPSPSRCEEIHNIIFNAAAAAARNCHDPWKIKKVLTKTDLGSNCNILIKRELAEDFIVPVLGGRRVCESNDVHVRVWDLDSNSLHSLVFTIRASNNSHVFKSTWYKDFVIRKGLKIGDEIGMFWDRDYQCFVFSVLRA